MKYIGKLLLLVALLLFGNTVFGQWSWNAISFNASKRLQSLHYITEDLGYVIKATDITGTKTVEKTTNGGATWTEVTLPVVGQELQSIHFHADGAGVVVYRNLQDPIAPTKIYQTLNDGTNWQDISPDTTASGMGTAVCQFLDQDTGFFATDSYLYATVDGGANWVKHTFTVYPMSISFLDAQHGTIGTFDGTFNYFGGMLTTTNGGQTWTQTSLTDNGTVIGVVGQLSPTVSFAAPVRFGAYGQHRFFRTTDNGLTWDTLAVPTTLTPSELSAIDFWDELRGVATITETGGITFSYQTTDGGNTWNYFDVLSEQSISDLQLVGSTGYITSAALGYFFRLNAGMSTADAQAGNFKVFPNPVASGLGIHFEGMQDWAELTLLDITGKVVFAGRSTDDALTLPQLKAGVYFLRMNDLEGTKYAKLIVE